LHKIAVVDDHALTLDGIVRTLSDADDMTVVATANSGSDVMALVKQELPDVLLLDINLPGIDGLACLELIRHNHPDVKVVMLSSYDDEAHVMGAFDRGAAAYVVKSVTPADLPSAVRQVVMGTVFCPYVDRTKAKSEGKRDHGLTERERTMLAAVARGLSNKAISREYWVTEQTVKFHLNNVYRKLGVENRAGAVRYAFEHGLAEHEPLSA
jgi:DNA-binding NarL/FixJ family response regulator